MLMPLEKLPDDVETGEEFKLDAYTNGKIKTGSFYVTK